MARPFSYPEVAALEVGGACEVEAPLSEVRRKVALYGRRHRRIFQVDSADAHCGDGKVALVTRLPYPVPEVA